MLRALLHDRSIGCVRHGPRPQGSFNGRCSLRHSCTSGGGEFPHRLFFRLLRREGGRLRALFDVQARGSGSASCLPSDAFRPVPGGGHFDFLFAFIRFYFTNLGALQSCVASAHARWHQTEPGCVQAESPRRSHQASGGRVHRTLHWKSLINESPGIFLYCFVIQQLIQHFLVAFGGSYYVTLARDGQWCGYGFGFRSRLALAVIFIKKFHLASKKRRWNPGRCSVNLKEYCGGRV